MIRILLSFAAGVILCHLLRPDPAPVYVYRDVPCATPEITNDGLIPVERICDTSEQEQAVWRRMGVKFDCASARQ